MIIIMAMLAPVCIRNIKYKSLVTEQRWLFTHALMLIHESAFVWFLVTASFIVPTVEETRVPWENHQPAASH
jgi:hypothetical protein